MLNSTQVEPWIEELIQNYGTQQRTARVMARVLRVDEATVSLKELSEDPVALLLLSDGAAAIRAILTRQALQTLLSGPYGLRAGETVSSLAGHSVFLLRYSLMAQREVEEGKWQLMLTVHELATTFTPKDYKPRRPLQEGLSSDGEPCCSESPATACQDRLSSLLEEVRRLLSPPSGPDCQGCPLYARTGWDRHRIRHKDSAPFSIPVCCCYISEQQREVMQRQAASLCVSVTCSSGKQWEEDYPHSPDSENDSLLEFGNQEKVPINPWDRFASEVEIRTLSEEGSGSASPEGLPEIDDSPLCSPPPHHSQPDVVSMATGRQMSTWGNRPVPCQRRANEGLESAGGSEDLRGLSNQSNYPPAEPASSSIEPSPSPVWARLLVKDLTLSLGLGPCHSSHWDRLRLRPQICPPLSSPPICELKIQQGEGVLLSKSTEGNQRRKRTSESADEDVGVRGDKEDQEGGGLHRDLTVVDPLRKKNPNFSLAGTAALQDQGLSGAQLSPAPSMHITKPVRMDPGGTPSGYTYNPKGCVAVAPGLLRVPDDILRWTVRYLIHKVPYESTS